MSYNEDYYSYLSANLVTSNHSLPPNYMDNERYEEKEEYAKNNTLINGELSNFPNPFRSATNFTYTLMEKQPISIIVKDIMGQEIARPLNNEVQDMGCYKLAFDASGLSHGIYFYTLQTATHSETKKMVKVE